MGYSSPGVFLNPCVTFVSYMVNFKAISRVGVSYLLILAKLLFLVGAFCPVNHRPFGY